MKSRSKIFFATALSALLTLTGCSAIGGSKGASAHTSASAASPDALVVPAGIKASVVVYDRTTKTFTEQLNPDQQYRSASLVKLLITLDYLWDRGPAYTMPAADNERLSLMLQRSDDDAASYYYNAQGKAEVITRMVKRLNLQHTNPPTAPRTGWGAMAISASDTVRIYQYILDKAPVPVRQFIMDNLHASKPCGTDGYNQTFGIPTAFYNKHWAAKNGWYEFAGADKHCQAATAHAAVVQAAASPGPLLPRGPVAAAAPTPVNWDDEVLHSTGTAGANDRNIVVILTASPHGTLFTKATATITQLARSAHVNL